MSREVKRFTFFWMDGNRDVFDGNSPEDALNKAGYGVGAIRGLDFYAEGERNEWAWFKSKGWIKTA